MDVITNARADWILCVTADYFGLKAHAIMSKRRTADVVQARQVVMYLIRTRLKLSYPRIGEILDRDHSSVMHGYKKIQADMTEGSDCAGFISDITAILGPAP